jgi:hypothetical protein
MAELNLPKPKIGKTDKETIQNLFDCIELMRKEFLNFARYIDSDNVTEINTNQTTVKSDKGTTQIKGPLLLMYDKQDPPMLRLEMGYDTVTSKFIFQMYDASGNLTLSENDAGEAVFSGNIATLKDVHIGNNLYLGDFTQQGVLKNIIFNDAASIYSYYLEGVGPAIAVNGAVFDIIVSVVYAAGNWFFNNASVFGLEDSGYAMREYVDNVMAQHIALFHSG